MGRYDVFIFVNGVLPGRIVFKMVCAPADGKGDIFVVGQILEIGIIQNSAEEDYA